MAVVALLGLVVIGEDFTAVVRDQGSHNIDVAVLAGVRNGAVAFPVLTHSVPDGVMRERKVDGREVVMRDTTYEDNGCEVLGR